MCIALLLLFCRYIFLEYSSPFHAQEAVKTTNGYKLDKTHTFAVNLFSDFEKYVYLYKAFLFVFYMYDR